MIIACIISFIIGTFVMFFIIGLSHQNDKKPHNNVHLYVARDKDKTLWLFLGKPIRDYNCYITKICGSVISNSYNFKDFGLNPDDFKDLKWEDEPVEVFLKLDD